MGCLRMIICGHLTEVICKVISNWIVTCILIVLEKIIPCIIHNWHKISFIYPGNAIFTWNMKCDINRKLKWHEIFATQNMSQAMQKRIHQKISMEQEKIHENMERSSVIRQLNSIKKWQLEVWMSWAKLLSGQTYIWYLNTIHICPNSVRLKYETQILFKPTHLCIWLTYAI